MATAIAVAPEAAPDGTIDDEVVIGLWLDGAPESTQAAYGRDMTRFRALVSKPISEISVADIQRYQHGLNGAPSSRNRAMNALRSFFRFAHSVGHLGFNPMTVIRGNKLRPSLGRKYLSTAEVHSLIADEPNERNWLMLEVLYFGALRVSELCRLTWRDVLDRTELESVQLSVLGKGGIPREVPLPPGLSEALLAFRKDVPLDAPVYPRGTAAVTSTAPRYASSRRPPNGWASRSRFPPIGGAMPTPPTPLHRASRFMSSRTPSAILRSA